MTAYVDMDYSYPFLDQIQHSGQTVNGRAVAGGFLETCILFKALGVWGGPVGFNMVTLTRYID